MGKFERIGRLRYKVTIDGESRIFNDRRKALDTAKLNKFEKELLAATPKPKPKQKVSLEAIKEDAKDGRLKKSTIEAIKKLDSEE